MNIPNNIQLVTRDEHMRMHMHNKTYNNPVHKQETEAVNKTEPTVRAMYSNYMKTCRQIDVGV